MEKNEIEAEGGELPARCLVAFQAARLSNPLGGLSEEKAPNLQAPKGPPRARPLASLLGQPDILVAEGSFLHCW